MQVSTAHVFILTRSFQVLSLTVRVPNFNGLYHADNGRLYQQDQIFATYGAAEAAGRARLQKRIDRSKREAARLAQYSRNLGGAE